MGALITSSCWLAWSTKVVVLDVPRRRGASNGDKNIDSSSSHRPS